MKPYIIGSKSDRMTFLSLEYFIFSQITGAELTVWDISRPKLMFSM